MSPAAPDPPSVAVPAATLIVMRDRGAGAAPELLMIERAAEMSFAGGALVFPGGRVDPGGRLLAAPADDPEDAAGRVAAVRETIEETGVAVGLSPVPGAAAVAALRATLAAGGDFAALLAAAELALEPGALVAFARWRPAASMRRVFDTRFYLVRAPADAAASPDGIETRAAFWMSASDVLAAAARGETRLIFPTRRNLERLARFASFAEAVEDAARNPVTTITPYVERRGGADWLCIPEGLGYPVTGEPLTDAMRA